MAKCGPKNKVTVEELLDDVEGYLLTADPPIIKEFAILHGISRQRLYKIAEECAAVGDMRLKEAMQLIIDSKEVMLEKKGLTGEYTSTMAVFSLKQLGWTDNKTTTVSFGGEQEDDPLTKSLKEFAENYNAVE